MTKSQNQTKKKQAKVGSEYKEIKCKTQQSLETTGLDRK